MFNEFSHDGDKIQELQSFVIDSHKLFEVRNSNHQIIGVCLALTK